MSGSAQPGGSGSSPDPRRLFRGEGAISDADLRVDVAKEVTQLIVADERTRVISKKANVRGASSLRTGSRDRHIRGNYTRKIHGRDAVAPGGMYREDVLGGVHLNALKDGESIVGGAYINMVTGGFMRMAAWLDGLYWGGWLEVDVMRMELSGAMIRAYMGYVHAAGMRICAAATLVDDWSSRNETFGACMDQTTGDNYLIAPGGGDSLEV